MKAALDLSNYFTEVYLNIWSFHMYSVFILKIKIECLKIGLKERE